MEAPFLEDYHCLRDLEWVQLGALLGSTNCAFQLYAAVRLGLNLMDRQVASVVQAGGWYVTVPKEVHLYGALPLPKAPSAKQKPSEVHG